jgi:hypothetical protein
LGFAQRLQQVLHTPPPSPHYAFPRENYFHQIIYNMNSIKDKNLLFYSIHPSDEHSRNFMKELDKNPGLKKQFVLVCVNDPNIRIPDKILQLNKVPVLIISGFNTPILGNDAISWLTNNSFQDKANGLDYGALNSDDSKFAYISDDTKTSDYNQFFNSEYNHGFVEKEGVVNQQFSNLKTDARITTFDDSNELKKDIQAKMDQRLSELRQQRDSDVPRPMKRIGGLESGMSTGTTASMAEMSSVSSQRFPSQESNVPAYNPNPFGPHNIPQQTTAQPQQRQLPFAMSQMGGRPNLPVNMPMSNGSRLPFQMGQRPVNNRL